MWGSAVELFFTLRAREGRNENPPLLAVCRRGVRNGVPQTRYDMKLTGPGGGPIFIAGP